MKANLLTMEDVEPGIQEVILEIDALYLDDNQKEHFEQKLLKFLESDPVHSEIFHRRDNAVTYLTENLVPKKKDQRPPLLLLFGNPASHSVASGMFFSYEGNEREHRFWKILSRAGMLSFSPLSVGDSQESLNELNKSRKTELFELSYDSPFRIGLAVFYTMPSPASLCPWAGVRGLNRLFGREALARVGRVEKERMERIIGEFVSPDGAVVTFQKDAYLAIKSAATPGYELPKAKAGHLIGNCQCDSDIRLFCLPPTRLLHGYLDLVQDFRDRILKAKHNSSIR